MFETEKIKVAFAGDLLLRKLFLDLLQNLDWSKYYASFLYFIVNEELRSKKGGSGRLYRFFWGNR